MKYKYLILIFYLFIPFTHANSTVLSRELLNSEINAQLITGVIIEEIQIEENHELDELTSQLPQEYVLKDYNIQGSFVLTKEFYLEFPSLGSNKSIYQKIGLINESKPFSASVQSLTTDESTKLFIDDLKTPIFAPYITNDKIPPEALLVGTNRFLQYVAERQDHYAKLYESLSPTLIKIKELKEKERQLSTELEAYWSAITLNGNHFNSRADFLRYANTEVKNHIENENPKQFAENYIKEKYLPNAKYYDSWDPTIDKLKQQMDKAIDNQLEQFNSSLRVLKEKEEKLIAQYYMPVIGKYNELDKISLDIETLSSEIKLKLIEYKQYCTNLSSYSELMTLEPTHCDDI
ncbi:hypothetical protein [Thorsellia anophelis]|uniref:Uncharacterized protein n=1 Tax=Thorsellia anophelis DSM 18579 TaxID=1123402 RepID=A0A1I0E8L3_9GAMM|nr:hypothetical protein [Thorsellia anophelis]SET41407.1 hypothetical protein SAMN02583745_02286 [Thorsellia anophelis DSM 18579]